jgi:hypothetical protein
MSTSPSWSPTPLAVPVVVVLAWGRTVGGPQGRRAARVPRDSRARWRIATGTPLVRWT